LVAENAAAFTNIPRVGDDSSLIRSCLDGPSANNNGGLGIQSHRVAWEKAVEFGNGL